MIHDPFSRNHDTPVRIGTNNDGRAFSLRATTVIDAQPSKARTSKMVKVGKRIVRRVTYRGKGEEHMENDRDVADELRRQDELDAWLAKIMAS